MEIFKEVLRLAELNPDETLFVDDSPVNIESAEQAGMHGLLNRHLDDWISEL
jgi:HAD superfamily hydrolase (TIGR01509 family)